MYEILDSDWLMFEILDSDWLMFEILDSDWLLTLSIQQKPVSGSVTQSLKSTPAAPSSPSYCLEFLNVDSDDDLCLEEPRLMKSAEHEPRTSNNPTQE